MSNHHLTIRPFLLIAVVVFITTSAFVTLKKDKLKEVKNIIKGSSVIYTYNPDGNIATAKNSNGVASKYEYHPDVIYRHTEDPRDHSSFTDTFLLDGKGFAIELHSAFHANFANSISQYDYDANGFPTETRMMHEGAVAMVTKYTYKDSNEVSYRQNFPGDPRINTGHATFLKDKLNTIGNDNMGTGFLGHSSKNLMSEGAHLWSDGETSRTYCRYHFDEKGRVIIKASYYKEGKLGDSTAYSYY